MSMSPNKTNEIPERIGDVAAMQPLSGVVSVNESGAVRGIGHAAFIRSEETADSAKSSSAN